MRKRREKRYNKSVNVKELQLRKSLIGGSCSTPGKNYSCPAFNISFSVYLQCSLNTEQFRTQLHPSQKEKESKAGLCSSAFRNREPEKNLLSHSYLLHFVFPLQTSYSRKSESLCLDPYYNSATNTAASGCKSVFIDKQDLTEKGKTITYDAYFSLTEVYSVNGYKAC